MIGANRPIEETGRIRYMVAWYDHVHNVTRWQLYDDFASSLYFGFAQEKTLADTVRYLDPVIGETLVDWEALFGALYPCLAPAVKAWWQRKDRGT